MTTATASPALFGGVRFSDVPSVENVHLMDCLALPCVSDMQRYGIRLDCPRLHALTAEIKEKQRDIEAELAVHLGGYQDFNGKSYQPFQVGSPDHVSRLLFDHLRVQGDDVVPMTPKEKRYTTSDDVLMIYAGHPVVDLTLEWRELGKVRGAYTEPLPLLVDSDSYLHPRFNPTVVASGRFSASYVQTIPIGDGLTGMGKKVREAFIASPGCVLISCDLSQIEMRIAAHLSQDPAMCRVFNEDGDIHVMTACAVFGRDYEKVLPLYKAMENGTCPESEKSWLKKFKQEERLPSKSTGFAVLYEVTDTGLQTYLVTCGLKKSDWPSESCQRLIDGFYGRYPGILQLQEAHHQRVTRYGMDWDMFGRVRLIPEGKSALKRIRNEGFRKASNHPIQGSAGGVLKLSMAELNPQYREMAKSFRCAPCLTIHDAVLLDADRAMAEEVAGLTREVMENAVPLDVPVRSSADTGERWSDL